MKTKSTEQKKRILPGFTLLEVLLVVAIIAILAGIVILALNPAKQLGDSRNSRRRSDVATILNSVYQYAIDNNGNFPTGVVATGTASVLGTDASGCDTTCTATSTLAACLDLSGDLLPDYLSGIPADPTSGDDANTDYYLIRLSTGRISVGSCDTEESATIEITR